MSRSLYTLLILIAISTSLVSSAEAQTCQSSVSANSTTQGSWSSGCTSAHRSGRYAKYYVFTISETVAVQVDLVSGTDAYLILLAGNGRGGSVIAENDDGGGNNNSRINRTLPPGTYTVEATTYRSAATGSFTLTLRTAGASTCQFSVASTSVSSGSWSTGCISAHRTGRYAKYYTFTVSTTLTFQADLVSATDAYLFLLSGSGSGGAVLAENDDSGGNNNSRISRTLAPGTYTLEATTFNSGAIGSFTLTLQTAGGGGAACQLSVAPTSVSSGSWSTGCISAHRAGRYAKYYTFTVSSTLTFQADLVSATDAYLFLLSGSGSGGAVLAENDDGGGNNNSRISRTLAPGTYTLEATTFNSGATGSFTLTLQTAGGGGATCQFSVAPTSVSSGSWSTGCISAHRAGRYAKYYTFTVSTTLTFQADLVSATDAYLFLLSGSGSGGAVLAENDDGGGNNNSRISRTLAPGTYTLEATTFNSGATGSFALTLQGSGQAVDPLACLIFVHGSREADGAAGYDWADDWQAGRNYWMEKNFPYRLLSADEDFIRAATNAGQRKFYVVRYNGAAAWWEDEAAGRVSAEIVRATDGLADEGGNRCQTSAANGGVFWVITHSGGANVLDYILGNSRSSDPHYNANGPFSQAAERISGVISVGGAHRGTPVADIICNPQDSRCPQLGKTCTRARTWLRTADAYQVSRESSSPSKIVWLTGGYKNSTGSCTAALPGEDDTVLPYASQFACQGNALQSYDNGNVCGNNAKQESANFRNLDAAYEDHDDEKNEYDTLFDRARRSIPDGVWNCNNQPCAPDTRVQDDTSTAAFVDRLLRDAFQRSTALEFELPPLRQTSGLAYLEAARYAGSSAPLEDEEDPIARGQRVTPASVRGPDGESPTLTVYPAAVSFEAPGPALIQAYLEENGSRQPAGHLSGTVLDAKGRAVDTLGFRDDGEGGDLVAGDLLYSALFNPAAGQERKSAGIYSVSVKAVSPEGIERNATSAFRYSAPDARLTGRFDDRLKDGSLVIRAQVEVIAPGRFHLEGTLATPEGRLLAWAQEARSLKPGRHWIPLVFYGLVLHEKGFDGPYVLRYAVLSTTTRVPASQGRPLENGHVTSPYRALDFTDRPFNDPKLLENAGRLLRAPQP